MARAAASTLAPYMRVKDRDAGLERKTLEGIAAWSGRFTPNVSLTTSQDGTQGLLLEVSGSLKLFGNLAAITNGLMQGVTELGFSPRAGSAPTAHGAWLLARAGSPSPCLKQSDLLRRLQPLPIEVLECDRRVRETLEAMGVRTIGEVLGLPRAGLARRFGQSLCEELDRAQGKRPDTREFFVPPDRFEAVLELPAEVREAEALLFALRRLIAQLGGFLEARNGGVQRLRIELFHKEASSEVSIGLVKPCRDTDRFLLLAREKFSSLILKQPVRRIGLKAEDIYSLSPTNLDLLDDTLKSKGDWHTLVERLRARLGNPAVSGIASYPAHRPEAGWRVTEPGERAPSCEFGPRPLWLLPHPRRLQEGEAPLCEGPLDLLSGPERIESGWWDGHDQARDYFVARSANDALLWVYRDREQDKPQWYLHGIFG